MIPDILTNDVKAKDRERQEIQSHVDEFLKHNEITRYNSFTTTLDIAKQCPQFVFSNKPSCISNTRVERHSGKRKELKGLTFGGKR